jgi:hypothetical protein
LSNRFIGQLQVVSTKSYNPIADFQKSLGHARSSHSSLVVSWQRVYNSLTVTTAHDKSSLHILIPFLPVLFDCHFKRLTQFWFQLAWDPRFIALGLPQQKTPEHGCFNVPSTAVEKLVGPPPQCCPYFLKKKTALPETTRLSDTWWLRPTENYICSRFRICCQGSGSKQVL